MVHSLWDTETNDLVAEYLRCLDALALVVRAIERNGAHDVERLPLDGEEERGRVKTIASGRELAAVAYLALRPVWLA